MSSFKPVVEVLEDRDCPSITTNLLNGILFIGGAPAPDTGDRLIITGSQAGGIQVLDQVAGTTTQYGPNQVNQINFQGSGNGDFVENLSNVQSIMIETHGSNNLSSAAPGSSFLAANGNNILSDISKIGGNGNMLFVVANGHNDIQTVSGGNKIYTLDGSSEIYAIIGTNYVNSQGTDELIVNNTDVITANMFDHVTTFQPRPSPVQISGDTLYIRSQGGVTNVTTVNEVNDMLVVSFADGGPAQTYTFAAKQTNYVAYWANGSNSSFVNNTDLQTISYSTGSNSTIVGGFATALEKVGANGFATGMSGNDELEALGPGGTLTETQKGESILRPNQNTQTFEASPDRDIVFGKFAPYLFSDHISLYGQHDLPLVAVGNVVLTHHGYQANPYGFDSFLTDEDALIWADGHKDSGI